jgi:hypothetical protein
MYCQYCGHPTLCETCLEIAFDAVPARLGVENLPVAVEVKAVKKVDISSGEDGGLMAYFRSKHEGESPTPSYVGQ